ncbi:hypothetical protein INR49_018098 [Caranx melampygus]|nr:hypothetical protein INR49_018098 [Caranx melampygus]
MLTENRGHVPIVVHPSPTSRHIWFDHLHPKPLLATPACTSSILCVIIATLLAIAKGEVALRDGQAQGLLLPPNRLRRLSYTRPSLPEIWCRGSAAPIMSPHHWPALPSNHSRPYLSAGGTSSLTCRYPTNGRACLPCPEKRGTQLRRERNRCSEIRAAIQPGRKPQSHCFHRLNQQATAQPQMEILVQTMVVVWFKLKAMTDRGTAIAGATFPLAAGRGALPAG